MSAPAQQRHPLIGSWKLVSWQVIADDGTPHDVFGASPKGYLVLMPEGRSIVVTTAAGRNGGMDDANRATLHKSMLAYSGRYRVEGNDFITTVEVSWIEEWNGTEQWRHYRIEGDKLFIEVRASSQHRLSRQDRFQAHRMGTREVRRTGKVASGQIRNPR